MNAFDRLYELHRLLESRRGPMSTAQLMQELGCSRASLDRTLRDLRDRFGAPVLNSPGVGYFYDRHAIKPFQLPGLWFSAEELRALLLTEQLVEQLEPGILRDHLDPFLRRIRELLAKASARRERFPANRIRLLTTHTRAPRSTWFREAADAVIEGRRLRIRYRGRARDEETDRTISPQRLIHYRDNWYLDAYCHAAEGLRTFALERIASLERVDEAALEIDAAELDQHLATSYGIFAGPPRHRAKLRFTRDRARWVADEIWHPDQQGQFDIHGNYELVVPYGDPRELIGEILRHSPEVEVLAPSSLRKEVQNALDRARRQYPG